MAKEENVTLDLLKRMIDTSTEKLEEVDDDKSK